MLQITHRRPLLVVLMLLLAAISGCATMDGAGTLPDQQATNAEEQFQRGEFRPAAQTFLALAQANSGGRNHYRLRAAESLREEGDLPASEAALEGVKRKRLTNDEALRFDMLDAEFALAHHEAARALSLLAMPSGQLSPALETRRLELSARAQADSGDAYAAARTRAALDPSLSGPDREQNRGQIVDTLAALDASDLKQRAAGLPASDPLRPWIERALRKQGQSLPLATLRPSRPVGTLQPGTSESWSREGYTASRRIALLLPAAGALKTAAAAIRDGFLAAYFNDRSDGVQRGEVKTYDSGTSPEDALNAYKRAVAEGADRIVGPLSREAVGLLFEQGRLDVPVLALNQADSGVTPPPGSIAFGLLPDAEGAQAAEHLIELGLREAAVIAATDDWAERASLAFRVQYESLGGAIVGEARIKDSEVNYAAAIRQAAGNFQHATGTAVFISMRPQQARLLMPQFKLAGLSLPVYGSSHVYAGSVNPGLDRDLDGLEFCDSPWLLDASAGLPRRDDLARSIESARGSGARLFALGMDAYALLPYMEWLGTHSDSYLPGATGQLASDSFGRVRRLLTWARFDNGVAHPAAGGLSFSNGNAP
ncbi:MAG: penicillin-binding protein activator [Tahibacter sp.]